MHCSQHVGLDFLHGTAQALDIQHDIALGYISLVPVLQQPFESIGGDVQAFSNGDEGAAQVVGSELDLSGGTGLGAVILRTGNGLIEPTTTVLTRKSLYMTKKTTN